MHPRSARELRTITVMAGMYCAAYHQGSAPCAGCQDLLAYARERLLACLFGGKKPACADCRIHCYEPARHARVIAVMRWAGPRMAVRHPYLALRHFLGARRF